MRRPLAMRLLVLGCSLMAALTASEVFFRWRAHRQNANTLEAAFAKPMELAHGQFAALRNIILPSRNDRIAYELRAGMESVNFKGAPLSTNSHGFRSPEIPVAEPPGAVTIVGLGDSVMFGHGVGDGECYLDRLGELLRERRPGTEWRIVNTGVPGYNTVMQVETLERKVLAFSPDLVVLGVVDNDYEPPQYVRTADEITDLSRSFLLEWVVERLTGESLMAQEGRALTHRDAWQKGAGVAAPPRYAELYGKQGFEDALDRLAALSDEHEFSVIAFLSLDSERGAEMLAACERRGFFSVNQQDELSRRLEEETGRPFDWKDLIASDFVVSPGNLHPSVRTHRMSAELLLEELEEVGWIDRVVAER